MNYLGAFRVFSGRSNYDLYCDEETDISKMTSHGFEIWSVAVRRGRRCDQSRALPTTLGSRFERRAPLERFKDM